MTLKRIAIIPIIVLAISFNAFAVEAKKSGNKQSKQKNVPISETILTNQQQSEFEYMFIEALKQKQSGNLDAAQQLFSRCLEIDPLSAVCMYEMGKLHFQKKDVTSATLLLERSIDVNPKNSWYKLTLAQIYRQVAKFDKAAALYHSLYEQDKDEQYLYVEAILWGMAKDYNKSLEAYDTYAKVTGKYEAVAIAKQGIYQENGDMDKAISEMKSLIKSYPKNPSYYGLLAELYNKVGNDEQALASYQKIFEIDPDNGFVYISLAGYYLEKGDKEKGYENLKKAFVNTKLDADTKIQFYLAYAAQEKESPWTNEQIDELLDILHNLYPDDERMYAVYADHLMRQGKTKEARENVQSFLAKNPESYEMWWQYLLLSNDLEEWQRLCDDATTALTHFPEQPAIYMWKALGELQLEKYADAIASSEKGLTYVGDNSFIEEQLLVFKADANYQLGNVDVALKAYAKVVKNNPTNYGALNNYAYYLAEANGDLDEAESWANKAVQANPTNSTFLDTYAWILFKQGSYALAKFYQETALEHNEPKNGLLIEHYGDILYKLGEKDKALEQWNKAKGLEEVSPLLEKKIKSKTYIAE